MNGYRMEFISGVDGLASAEFRAEWSKANSRSTHFRALQQIPEYVEHRQPFPGKLTLCIARAADGGIVGVTPLLDGKYGLDLRVGARTLCKMSVGASLLMGNAPAVPTDFEAYEAFFDALASQPGVNAVYSVGMSRDSRFCEFLDQLEKRRDSPWFFYRQFTPARYHYIRMPASFDDYLRGLDSKLKRNLRREAKLLRAHAGGELDLERIERPQQVRGFLEAARAIAGRSWQKRLLCQPLDEISPRLELLTSTAEAGILRSYLLKCGGLPCAYGIGFQLNGIFSYFETAYDEKWGSLSLSPGKYMLVSMLQDLFCHQRPQTFFFGYGDEVYKHRFANASGDEITVHILRKNLANRLKVAAHRSFYAVSRRLRRFKPGRERAIEDAVKESVRAPRANAASSGIRGDSAPSIDGLVGHSTR